MWLPVLSFNYFEDPHESAHWWETLQLYSMWLLVRSTKPFEKTHEIAHLWEALQLSWGSLKNKPIVLHLQQWCFFDWLAVGRFSYIYFWHRFSHQILDCREVHVRDEAVPLQVALVQQPLYLLVFQALTEVLNPEKISFIRNRMSQKNEISHKSSFPGELLSDEQEVHRWQVCQSLSCQRITTFKKNMFDIHLIIITSSEHQSLKLCIFDQNLITL